MISYFIPISLLVLAGFTLGVLVGRLAWGASKSEQVQTPPEPADLPESAEGTESSAEVVAESTEPPDPDVGPTAEASRSAESMELAESAEPSEEPIAEQESSSPTEDQAAPELPVWQMKEVRSRQRPFVTPSAATDIDLRSQADDDPDMVTPPQEVVESASGGNA